MKKLVALLLCTVLMLSCFSGCGLFVIPLFFLDDDDAGETAAASDYYTGNAVPPAEVTADIDIDGEAESTPAPMLPYVYDPDRDYREDPIPYSEIGYERPDPDVFEGKSEAIAEAVHTEDIDTVIEMLDDYFDEYYYYDTMYSIALIRSYVDATDEFYSDEYAFCEENAATVDMYTEDVYYACALSDLGPELEEQYFWEGFCEEYSDEDDSLYTEEYVALSEQESALLAEYRDLLSEPVICIDGVEFDYYEYVDEVQDNYSKYINALKAFYDTYYEPVAELYIKLVQVRKAMAETAGYKSFEAMEYEYAYDRDYTPEQVADFCEDVKRYIVPVNARFEETDAYYYMDSGSLDESKLRSLSESAAKDIGGSVYEAYAFMTENGYCDLAPSTKKVMGSFETYISNYDTPFVFLKPEEDLSDLTTLFHELGHFTSNFINHGEAETLDIAECYSTALQYMSTLYLKQWLGKYQGTNLDTLMISDILGVYTQQCSFAEFEQKAFAMSEDELTPEALGELFMELSQEYGYYFPGVDWYYTMGWIDITHFFESPYYVITYAVVTDVALQFYSLERAESGSGIAKYEDMIARESYYLLDVLDEIGLDSPFSPGRVKKCAALIENMMAE